MWGSKIDGAQWLSNQLFSRSDRPNRINSLPIGLPTKVDTADIFLPLFPVWLVHLDPALEPITQTTVRLH
jgi:hypothetical protein